jgi:ribulose bisphosphate carboxylase small subunit
MPAMEECRQHHPKPYIVVPVVRVVPVAIGTAQVLLIVVERPPTNHAAASELALFRTRDARSETFCNAQLKPSDSVA